MLVVKLKRPAKIALYLEEKRFQRSKLERRGPPRGGTSKQQGLS